MRKNSIISQAENLRSKSKLVSQEEWIVARKKLLAREKELTQLRDQVSRERRELPWVKVEKKYVFEGPDGKETLADLFGGRSQLVAKHFMFGPNERRAASAARSRWTISKARWCISNTTT
jgi:predicted dithiol-disulfide oxidoreductase (DUF899 family)